MIRFSFFLFEGRICLFSLGFFSLFHFFLFDEETGQFLQASS